MPQFQRLDAGFSRRSHGFNAGRLHVNSWWPQWDCSRLFSEFLQLYPAITIPTPAPYFLSLPLPLPSIWWNRPVRTESHPSSLRSGIRHCAWPEISTEQIIYFIVCILPMISIRSTLRIVCDRSNILEYTSTAWKTEHVRIRQQTHTTQSLHSKDTVRPMSCCLGLRIKHAFLFIWDIKFS